MSFSFYIYTILIMGVALVTSSVALVVWLMTRRRDAIISAIGFLAYMLDLSVIFFDEYNRIRTTDMRLLRRMVRDSQFRSHDAETTLRTWSDVRDGEEKYIFPYQSSADIIFNTTLIYEFAVLKKYAEPLLRAVPQSAGMAYTTARRLLNILSYVKPLEDEVIPNNSILREFIGGCTFYDE